MKFPWSSPDSEVTVMRCQPFLREIKAEFLMTEIKASYIYKLPPHSPVWVCEYHQKVMEQNGKFGNNIT